MCERRLRGHLLLEHASTEQSQQNRQAVDCANVGQKAEAEGQDGAFIAMISLRHMAAVGHSMMCVNA